MCEPSSLCIVSDIQTPFINYLCSCVYAGLDIIVVCCVQTRQFLLFVSTVSMEVMSETYIIPSDFQILPPIRIEQVREHFVLQTYYVLYSIRHYSNCLCFIYAYRL